MKATKILFVILSLTTLSLSDELILYINERNPNSAFYIESDTTATLGCSIAGECVKKSYTLKNVQIELIQIANNFQYFQYLPENLRKRRVLNNKMNSQFLNDINNLVLINVGVATHKETAYCYEINIYDGKHLIVTFAISAYRFYDKKTE